MNVKKRTHQKVILLVNFYLENGRWPKSYEKYKGVNIGAFGVNIRFGLTKISDFDRNFLKNINYEFKKINIHTHNRVLLLIEFYNKFNRWPKYTEQYKGIKIGVFFSNIKLKRTKLTDEDKKLLEKDGFYFTNIPANTHFKVNLLIEFLESFNRFPKTKEIYKGVNIGTFYSNLKSNKIRI